MKNLASLTLEGIHDFIVSIIIPRHACVWQEDEKAATGSANTSRPAMSTTVDGNIETPVDSICQEEGNQELTSALLQLGIGCVCYISSTTVKKELLCRRPRARGLR